MGPSAKSAAGVAKQKGWVEQKLLCSENGWVRVLTFCTGLETSQGH
jgi:hypothetical protein